MAEMKARITLDSSGYKSGAFSVIEDTENMINAAKKAKEAMEQLSNTRIKADTSEAEKNISKMRENLNNLKKNVSIMVQAKDEASQSINRIKSNVTSLVKSNYKLEISVLDKTKSVITGIRDSIFNLKTLAAGIVLGGAGKSAYDWTIGNGISNENYLATLQTVMHDKAKGSEALKWSYKTAQTTPFNAEQVVAGTTQLATSGLDYKKYLTPLGDAAAAFNRPIEQAIFAMGKLKSGQYGMAVDMFRDFGISNQDWTKAGATFSKNGEMQMSDPQKAVDMVTKIINQKYGGLMEKKSNTAGGMMSNIGDSISGMGRSLAGIDSEGQIMKGGLFDNFKEQLKTIMPLLDRIQKTQAFKNLQKDISNLATAGGQKLTAFLKGFDNPKTVKEYEANFKKFIEDVKAGVQIAREFGSALLAIGKVLEPLIKTVAAHPKLFIGLFAGFESIKGVLTITKTIKDLAVEFPILGTAISKFSSGAVKALGAISKIFVGNPWVVAIGLVVLAVAGLYEAWVHNWGGCRDYVEKIIKAVEDDWDAWKKEWTKLKEFFKDPITATVKSVKEGTTVSTKRVSGAGPQGLAVDSGHNALGTDYWKGGETWVGENGPEKLILPGGSKILSNRESMNMTSKSKEPNLATDFTEQGKNIPLDLAKGVKKTTQQAVDAVNLMAATTVKGFGTSTTTNSKYAIEPVDNLSTNIQGVFTILANNSNPLGKNVSQGLGQGMKDSESNVTDIAKTLTDKVIKTFTDGFDIHSPSKVMYAIGGHVMQGFVNGLNSKDLKAFADKHIQTITSAFGSAVNVPGGVSQWLMMALQATGTPLSWLPGLQKLVMAESGGDPNNWNSQSVGGEHATGLLQTLPSTFKEFMQKGMSNILNPVDNAAAAINYIKSRYGSVYNTPLFRGGSYAGYANGGIADKPSIFGEGQYPEAAIPLKKNSSRSQQLLDIADNYVNGDKKGTDKKDVNLIINFNGVTVGEEEFFDKAGDHIVKKVKLALSNL